VLEVFKLIKVELDRSLIKDYSSQMKKSNILLEITDNFIQTDWIKLLKITITFINKDQLINRNLEKLIIKFELLIFN